ncbi:diguanylate cyclase domain-containing protein [Pseudomonas sp. NA-150]|uniref:diguanylate cyclase domain-containing protein n=1 Tax=Pseudomonas sp. NA-150 TaxID=3367525 RepID=UPI0037CAFA0C
MERILESWLLHANRRPKILIADDQPTTIRVLHELFSAQCDVFMATSGAQALKVCQAELPDLILLDVVMDDIDGHEVCRQLKADPATSTIPIIFITAQNQEADEVVALGLGAVDFITKPINSVIVRARVGTQLTVKLQGDLLRASALLDGLTGVGNRRKFDDDLLTNWRQCLREKNPISLVLLDIDYFKRYNDHYGHQRGDACLKRVAKALSETLRRPYDSVARYGGEEFACILPRTGLEGALGMAETMLANIRELEIEHKGSDIDRVITASLGVATLTPTTGSGPEALLAAADIQLYQAKRSGRGRVCPKL